MENLKELYQKIINGYYNTSEIIEFVELAAKAINPDKNLSSNSVIAAIQNGFGDALLPIVIEAVEKNPTKVGFQVTKVYSKPLSNIMGRNLIKVFIKDIKNDN